MTNRYLLPIFLGLSLALAMTTACKKEKIDDTDDGYQITLTTEQEGRNIKLNWTKVNHSDFQNYVVVRSSEDISDSPTPNSQTIASIDDYKTNFFNDLSPLLTEYVYYKVYAKVGDRFLMSQTVKVTTNVKLLDIFASEPVFDQEKDLVYMFDANKQKVFKYDYAQETMVGTLDLPGTFQVHMALGKYNGKDELYVASNGSNFINVFDADDFELQTNISTNVNITSIAAGNNGLLYVGSNDWSGGFAVYSRSTKQLLDQDQSFLFTNGENSITVLSDDGLEVAIADFQTIGVFKISQQGLILDAINTFTSGIFFGTAINIAKSDDGEFIIPESIGNIFTNKLEPVGSLSTNVFQVFTDFAFSADNSKLWAANASTSTLQEFSFPSLQENRSFVLNYAVIRIAKGKDALIVVGIVSDSFGNTRTIVDKLRIL